MYTTFSESDSGVCSRTCSVELDQKRNRAIRKIKTTVARSLRIAELDPVADLDSIVADLDNIPDLAIERYMMPSDVYPLFASNPPPLGPAFPIATLEGDWSLEIQAKLDDKGRVYGIFAVKDVLLDIRETCFAVTRKMDKSLAEKIKAGLV